MDLHIRKLKLIEYLIGLQDEKIFRRIESQIEITKSNYRKDDVNRPISKSELVDRAKRSNKDYKDGNVLTQDQLENKSKNW